MEEDEPLDNQSDDMPQPTEKYLKDVEPYRKFKRKQRKSLIIWLALAALIVIGVAVYMLLLRPKPTNNNSQSQPQPQSAPANEQGITSKTKHHISNTFNLEFDYPEDWTVKESAESGLTATSPSIQLKDAATEQTTSGQIIFNIRSKQLPMPGFDKGNATAVRASERIAYAKPASGQRGSTYVSFLRYSESDDGMNGIYITGDTGYKADQPVPKADFVSVDPIIFITFRKSCNGNECSNAESLSIAPEAWDNASFSDPLKNMLESLVVK